ncbi:pyridoxal-phosphate dependent enzyme [Actinopolymorpha sp. B17G11]|uniref:pyridoxal-phosphate dependent enzyme n=1 Tax=Actinopolymorpha sp. B17G11 TaxID=3160861 RepID=UPI0032E447AC
MRLPCFTDVLRAGQTLRPHLPPTPAWSYPALDAACGAHVVVKHENVQPTGAFKVRGGLTLLATMPAAERDRGVVTYSTGNHAQSIAYAAREFRAPCTVVMPEGANESKHRAVEALGATVVLRGTTLEEARDRRHAARQPVWCSARQPCRRTRADRRRRYGLPRTAHGGT